MRLEQLTKRRDEIQLERTQWQKALTAERLKPEPLATEQRRLRDLIGECESALSDLADDIDFEQKRRTSAEDQKRIKCARDRRDRALATHASAINPRWLKLAELLRAATAEAAGISTVAQQAAADATAAVWAHFDNEVNSATRDQAGRVTTLALGDERHAHALTCLIRDLIAALPASLPSRLSQRYLDFNHSSLSGVPVTTMEAATSAAHEQLRARLAPLLA
jgi:hypothetical protein